jgi:acyl-coenzyme A thioesterase PaaI-like protein
MVYSTPVTLETLPQLTREIPYAQWINLRIDIVDTDPVFVLPYQDSHIGNPLLPALHGGLVGGFLEASAMLYVIWQCQLTDLPRLIDFSIDYLRSGKPLPVYGQCNIVRQGRRVANVEMRAWQETPDKPIVAARAHFLLGHE